MWKSDKALSQRQINLLHGSRKDEVTFQLKCHLIFCVQAKREAARFSKLVMKNKG